MKDTISQLDTATTDELIAAIVARHLAACGEGFGHRIDPAAVLDGVYDLDQELVRKFKVEILTATGRYVTTHPALTGLSTDRMTAVVFEFIRRREAKDRKKYTEILSAMLDSRRPRSRGPFGGIFDHGYDS